ncbi:MAG TPA: immunoglobulin domain-containing protein [Candidatus Hydrogenedentes bacterium]|nr:immunoglobulin domain-containing protein [Candidatus Hydrogenedentota bacterium]
MSRSVNRPMGMVALMVMICSYAWCGPNVLVLWDDDEGTEIPEGLNANTKALVSAMESAGLVVSYSYQTQGKYNGANPAPEAFDAVVHLNGGGQYSYIISNIGASRLVDYVKNRNGTYVGSENNAAQLAIPIQFGGLSQTMWEVTPIDRTRGWGTMDITISIIPGQESHPVLRNIPASFTFSSGHKDGTIRSFSEYPAQAIMRDNDGNDAAAVRELGKGHVIGFHHTGNTLGQDTLSNQYVQKLYINAVLWGDTKCPTVKSITRADSTPSSSATLSFVVQFSEGVTGVGPDDFTVEATGVEYQHSISVSPVTDREYKVMVNGVTGSGSLGIGLSDNDSIRDKSYNTNKLGGEGVGNGDLDGESYTVDRTAPVLSSLQANQVVVPLGGKAHFILTFSKTMNTSIVPKVVITTVSHGTIAASGIAGGGDGVWTNSITYEVTMDRAVVAQDEGVAGIAVTDAQDLVGNVMTPNSSYTIALIKGGLRILSEPPLFSYALAGQNFSFRVTVGGAAGTPNYEWYKEGFSRAYVPVGPNAPVFTLTNLSYSDSGTYYCVITDTLSSVQTHPSTLQVVKELPVAWWGLLVILACLCAGGGMLMMRRGSAWK